jgi:hypothetical protein
LDAFWLPSLVGNIIGGVSLWSPRSRMRSLSPTKPAQIRIYGLKAR